MNKFEVIDKIGINLDNNLFFKFLDQLHEGIYILDRNRKIIFWNKSAEDITGFTYDEVMGISCADNILRHVDKEGNNLCTGLCPVAMTLNDGSYRSVEVFLHHKEGYRIPVSIRVWPIFDSKNEIIGAIEVFSDISYCKKLEESVKELEKLAMYDSLTGVANRNFMEKEFYIKFEERTRIGINFGVLFIDIDDFKQFNDKYGHDIGDKVLKIVANVFLHNSRPFDIICRWGGDEFFIILYNVDFATLKSIAERLRMLVEKSFLIIENKRIGITISVGATMARDTDSIETLFKRVDALLYKSKKQGGNIITIE